MFKNDWLQFFVYQFFQLQQEKVVGQPPIGVPDKRGEIQQNSLQKHRNMS